MGCGSCALKASGACSTGGKTCGCNKRSVYNWLADLPEPAYRTIIPVEVSFKKGSRKAYYQCRTNFGTMTGDHVVVEAKNGYDIGQITMSGELVKLQLKKKKIKEKLPDLPKVIRKANDTDLSRLQDFRNKERETMTQARVIARNLGLEMKVGDVEYQGNGKKVTIYYTADDRVDFRQLIKEYASAFRVKIEMKQIGMRQESALIGGIGACGRELCCSTWLTDFKTVNTSAARYQNLSINQTKLTGQCGRLKCCLNYELDTYLDAWKKIPKKVDKIYTEEGVAFLQKTDILRHVLIYKYADKPQYYKLTAEDVAKIKEMNLNNEKPVNLNSLAIREATDFLEKDEDLVGQIQLESLPSRKRRSKRRKPAGNRQKSTNQGKKASGNKPKNNKKQQPAKAKVAKEGEGQQKQNPNQNPNQKPNNKNKRRKNYKPKNKQNAAAKQQNQQKAGDQQNKPKQNRQNKPKPQQGNNSGEGNKQQANAKKKPFNKKKRYPRKNYNNNKPKGNENNKPAE